MGWVSPSPKTDQIVKIGELARNTLHRASRPTFLQALIRCYHGINIKSIFFTSFCNASKNVTKASFPLLQYFPVFYSILLQKTGKYSNRREEIFITYSEALQSEVKKIGL